MKTCFLFLLLVNAAFAQTPIGSTKLPEIKDVTATKCVPYGCGEDRVCAPGCPAYRIDGREATLKEFQAKIISECSTGGCVCDRKTLTCEKPAGGIYPEEKEYSYPESRSVYRQVRNCNVAGRSNCPSLAEPVLRSIGGQESTCFSSCYANYLPRNITSGYRDYKNIYNSCKKIPPGTTVFCDRVIRDADAICNSQCGGKDDVKLDEIKTARDDATEDWLDAIEDWKSVSAARLEVEKEAPVVQKSARYFRPLIGRAPRETPGVEISSSGYPMLSFLSRFAQENNTSFSIYQSGGNVYLLRTDNQAQVLFDGAGVSQGEQIVFPWINANSFSGDKSAAGFSGRISGLENIADVSVSKIVSPDGKNEWLVPKIEIAAIAPPGGYETQIIIERNGKEIKKIPLIVEVEKPLVSGWIYFFRIIFWAGILYLIYAKIIKKRFSNILETAKERLKRAAGKAKIEEKPEKKKSSLVLKSLRAAGLLLIFSMIFYAIGIGEKGSFFYSFAQLSAIGLIIYGVYRLIKAVRRKLS